MMYSSAISRIALSQFLVIVIGVFATGMMVKIHGAGAPELDWNPAALAVKRCGYLLMILPVLWTGACFAMERKKPDQWTRSWSLVSGVFLLALVGGFLMWTACVPYFFHKMPLQIL